MTPRRWRVHFIGLGAVTSVFAVAFGWVNVVIARADGFDKLGPALLAGVLVIAWVLYAIVTTTIAALIDHPRAIGTMHVTVPIVCVIGLGAFYFAARETPREPSAPREVPSAASGATR